MYSVVLFHTTNSALRLEKLCKKAGINIKLIPVPRHLSSDCGVCLRFEKESAETIKTIIEKNSIEIVDIYSI